MVELLLGVGLILNTIAIVCLALQRTREHHIVSRMKEVLDECDAFDQECWFARQLEKRLEKDPNKSDSAVAGKIIPPGHIG
jgi:hypothetical protein